MKSQYSSQKSYEGSIFNKARTFDENGVIRVDLQKSNKFLSNKPSLENSI